MPRLVYSANYLIEANKTNIVPQVVGMVEISSGGFAPGTITAHATFSLPSPYNYDGRLRDVSSIDCSLNGAYGRVSFAITNADLGEVANVAADKYVGWECKVHKIIILEDGTLLGILLLHGVIMSYTMTDRVVEMDVLTRINVGNTITPRRVNVKCPWVFKGTECGYSGVLTDCNKLYSDAGGCSGRSNQHRFGGFPLRLPEASIGAVSGQGSAPTYQLIRDDSAFQLQRAILEFDNTFSVTDDPTNNKTVISVTGGGGGGSGTVTSVALTAPSILTVTGSPITTSGTLALALATQSAATVFAGPATGSAVAPTFRALVATDIPDLSSIYQPLDADLTAIAALTANGLLRKTAGVWGMDSASYLTANQTITLTGDVTGTGATSIATTIANAAVTFAKIQNINTNRLLGRVTASTGSVEEITPGTGVLTWLQTPTSANLAAAVTDETGSGALVFATSPTLITPNIGVATGTSFNGITGLSSTTPAANSGSGVVGTGTAAARSDHAHPTTGLGLTSGTLAQFAATTSSQLAGVISDETGSGALVFATSPTLVTPNIGVATGTSFNSITGLSSTTPGSTVTTTAVIGTATTAARADHVHAITDKAVTYAKIQDVTASRLLGRVTGSNGPIEEITPGIGVLTWLQTPTSANLAAAVTTTSTGSGALVFATSPTFTTPTLGAASATSVAFGAGTASAPSITATGDTDTGLFFSAANTISVTANGAACATFLTNNMFVGPLTAHPIPTLAGRGLVVAVDDIGEFQYFSTGAANVLRGWSFKGTLASPTATTLNQAFAIGFNGHDASGYISAGSALVRLRASENYTSAAQGGEILFETTANGSTSASRAARMTISHNGNIGISTTSPTAMLDINSNKIRLRTSKTITYGQTAGGNNIDAGDVGDICWDANYIYVRVSASNWRRVATATW